MKISVCIITYNHEKYIRDAIDSVLMQETDHPIEIVIGDDCSSDGTRQICEQYERKFPEKIRLFVNKRNVGLMPNFVNTLHACKGDYIALCEGDDYWTDPFKLQKQIEFLRTNPEYSFCFHAAKIMKNGKFLDDYITNVPAETTNIYHLVENSVYIHTHSIVFRNVIKDIFSDPKLQQLPTGDYVLQVLLAQFGKVKYFDDVMGVYRIHNSNTWVNQDIGYMLENIIPTQEYLIEYFDGNEDIVSRIKKLMEKRLAVLCKYHYNSGNTDKLKFWAKKLIDVNPSYFYDLIHTKVLAAKAHVNFFSLLKLKINKSILGKITRWLNTKDA